ncbi:hypothetical protein ACS0TY_019459 [Phlomoides rotata]
MPSTSRRRLLEPHPVRPRASARRTATHDASLPPAAAHPPPSPVTQTSLFLFQNLIERNPSVSV